MMWRETWETPEWARARLDALERIAIALERIAAAEEGRIASIRRLEERQDRLDAMAEDMERALAEERTEGERRMRKKRCVCGFMADVDEWNAKGVVMFCPECGAFDLSRDDLYEMGLQTRMMRVFFDRCRKQWKADAESPEIDDEAYRSACEMAVEMVDEMFRGLEDADREWRDEKRDEVEYLWRAGTVPSRTIPRENHY